MGFNLGRLTLVASDVGARGRRMQSVQNQGTLRQAGSLVAQHCASNCRTAMQTLERCLLLGN